MEITEEDFADMQKGIQAIQKKVKNVDFSNIASKEDIEICIGGECKKLSAGISSLQEKQGKISGEVDHLSELVHKGVQRPGRYPPPATRHAAARKAAQEKDTHSHPDFKDIADCPECYPKIIEALGPKLESEGYRKGALKFSDKARKALRGKGVPICTDCGVPWEADDKGNVEEKCINCGADKND